MKRSKMSGVVLIFMIVSLFVFSGCGGGGGGTAALPGGTVGGGAGSGVISGTAVKGPMDGATVRAYAISNGTKGMQLASAMTDSQGNFSMTIGDYTGPVMLLMSGGSYTDEATGSMMTMGMTDKMTAIIPMMSSGETVTVQVTPLTSMAQAMANNMTSGMTTTNSQTANTSVGMYFMVNDILHTTPMNPLVTDSGVGATQDMKNYGMTLAAMTEYAKALGMPDSSGIVTAMMNDASDGVMNGMMGGTSITMGGGMSMMGGGTMMSSTAGTSGLATAMTTFIGSPMNKSGVKAADMSALVSQLTMTNGTI
jgi:hypothetical protein